MDRSSSEIRSAVFGARACKSSESSGGHRIPAMDISASSENERNKKEGEKIEWSPSERASETSVQKGKSKCNRDGVTVRQSDEIEKDVLGAEYTHLLT